MTKTGAEIPRPSLKPHPAFFSQLSHIESALKSHYKLRDSHDLGFGSLHTLSGLVQRQRELIGGGISSIYYELALLAKHSKSRLVLTQIKLTEEQDDLVRITFPGLACAVINMYPYFEQR